MPYSFFNNSVLLSEEITFDASNRSFRYGDGLFETIFVSAREPLFIHAHIGRLMAGMQMLRINISSDWNVDFFSTQIKLLAEKNNYDHARCRITVWRNGGGLYLPETNTAGLLIELSMMENEYYEINPSGIKLGLYKETPKMIHPFSALKSAHAMPYILASLYAREQNDDDVVILNNEGRLADATSSNIFIYRDRKLFTPAVTEGGVDGIMRKVVMALCRQEGIEVNETELMPDELLKAEEIFLTNAIQGIKWVESYRHKKFKNEFARDLIFVLNEQKNNNSLVST